MKQNQKLLMSQHTAAVIRVQSSLDSLESHENKLQPKPGQRQHDDHVWEGETEPGSKVDDISILRKKSRESSESSIGRDKQAVTVEMGGGALTGSSVPSAPGWVQFLSAWLCLLCWRRNTRTGSSLYTSSSFPWPPCALRPPLRHLRKSPRLHLQGRNTPIVKRQLGFLHGADGGGDGGSPWPSPCLPSDSDVWSCSSVLRI